MPDDTALPERWREIPGYEGYYEVSDRGRVRSLARVVIRSDGQRQRVPGKIKKLTLDPAGYFRTMLIVRGSERRVRCRLVHGLVLAAFVGPRPPGFEVLHWDGNPANNCLANLRWGSHRENIADLMRHGRHGGLAKTHCPRAHLLQAPNLVPSHLKRGRRACWACVLAIGRQRHERAHGRDLDLQVESDRRYIEIMGRDLAS